MRSWNRRRSAVGRRGTAGTPLSCRRMHRGAIRHDDRPGAPSDNIYWSANVSEAGHFVRGYESVWLPASLLRTDQREHLTDALLAAGTLASVELHFQKGLAGASREAVAASADTATNPADAGCLRPRHHRQRGAAGLSRSGRLFDPTSPQLVTTPRRSPGPWSRCVRSVPEAGSYVAESSYFEHEWQRCYWGANYPRLLAVKQKYDPAGLFFVRHGVGSEQWSDDGFTRLSGP